MSASLSRTALLALLEPTASECGAEPRLVGSESLANGLTSFTFGGKTAIIAQRGEKNWFVCPVFYVTVNANGEVTAGVEGFDEVCK